MKRRPSEAKSEGMVDQDREYEREDEMQTGPPPKFPLKTDTQVTSGEEKTQGEANEGPGHGCDGEKGFVLVVYMHHRLLWTSCHRLNTSKAHMLRL